jgi:hypothetical protein
VSLNSRRARNNLVSSFSTRRDSVCKFTHKSFPPYIPHFPRLFLASNGLGRIEINYARIIGRAYTTFNPPPSETELQSWIQEYAKNNLLFLYLFDGQLWGVWDTRTELLPDYKTAQDKRSPIPPEPAFTEWKKTYRSEYNGFTKILPNFGQNFPVVVGELVGEVKPPPQSPLGGLDGISSSDPDALPEVNGKNHNSAAADSLEAIRHTAARIHERHPHSSEYPRRDCSAAQVEKRLTAILKRQGVSVAEREAYLERIDSNHAGMCASDAWQKDGGQFAKGLKNWLAPTEERYLVGAPASKPNHRELRIIL